MSNIEQTLSIIKPDAVERNLIEDRVKIIEYFKLLEKMNIEEEQRDIIVLKKALYLIKHSDKEKGYEI